MGEWSYYFWMVSGALVGVATRKRNSFNFGVFSLYLLSMVLVIAASVILFRVSRYVHDKWVIAYNWVDDLMDDEGEPDNTSNRPAQPSWWPPQG